ncbi:hypothetical protein PSQ19_14990 [Devosia algicola]|uniref:Uncharacterized protein n=1 Tax=Devosia algicola TaxID=3026418 RepID=A0ABY7YL17_9HYPH|nr:hypothetical protein [Devosia algicola]WDR01979.1 hypothetical protein PSQ19_14990 [Devosia algicola]
MQVAPDLLGETAHDAAQVGLATERPTTFAVTHNVVKRARDVIDLPCVRHAQIGHAAVFGDVGQNLFGLDAFAGHEPIGEP